jgi:hypothetical protein
LRWGGYWQTGSGKTYTMLGSEYGQPGLYMLAADELFTLQVSWIQSPSLLTICHVHTGDSVCASAYAATVQAMDNKMRFSSSYSVSGACVVGVGRRSLVMDGRSGSR